MAEKIALCDNYHFYDKEKELIEQYEEKSRLLGLKFYSKQNPRCYINMFLINLGDEYLKEKELHTETLYETIFTYCQAQSEAIKRNQKFFGDALIQYAIYLGENQTKYSKDKIESIISILDLLGENNRYEYFLLVAEQCKKTAIENRQNNNIDIELYQKQYNAYLKVYTLLKTPSVIDQYILPCLKEWIEVCEKYNLSVPKVMGKNISEWIEDMERG